MAIDLSSIVGGQRVLPPKVTVVGVGGIGKTTFAADAPNPIFLNTEEGQGLLDIERFPLCETWADVIGCVAALHGEHDYKTVVLDSMTFAEPMLHAHCCEKYNQTDISPRKGDFAFQRGYDVAVDEAMDLFRGLDSLRTKHGMGVVIICHAEPVKFESPDAETYKRYQPRLQGKLSARLHDWSDCLLFANYKVAVVTDEEGFNRERKRGVGTGERVLYTEERPAFWSKNRYGLPAELPLSWASFQSAIADSVAKSNKENN